MNWLMSLHYLSLYYDENIFYNFIIDPYVKVWLHVGDKKVEKRKSIVYKCNLNPVFDEKFEYTLPVEQLREAALEVMVMDFDNIGRNELIGKITISCKYMLFIIELEPLSL